MHLLINSLFYPLLLQNYLATPSLTNLAHFHLFTITTKEEDCLSYYTYQTFKGVFLLKKVFLVQLFKVTAFVLHPFRN